MLTLKDAVPCSICGEYPILHYCKNRGNGRLVCPNLRSEDKKHGNLARTGLPMGFTNWCYYFWSDEQKDDIGIPTVVAEWNMIHALHNEI